MKSKEDILCLQFYTKLVCPTKKLCLRGVEPSKPLSLVISLIINYQ